MLHECPGTTASDDVVMLSAAGPLRGCDVRCQLQTLRVFIAITVRGTAKRGAGFRGVEWIIVSCSGIELFASLSSQTA